MITAPQTEAVKLIGYFPKNAAVPAGWSASTHVTEVCSVSDGAIWLDRSLAPQRMGFL